MISIAAATVIAAGITGCGSSSSGTTTSTNGVATSVTATKGYVKDGNVTGWDANGTMIYQYTYKATFFAEFVAKKDDNSNASRHLKTRLKSS